MQPYPTTIPSYNGCQFFFLCRGQTEWTFYGVSLCDCGNCWCKSLLSISSLLCPKTIPRVCLALIAAIKWAEHGVCVCACVSVFENVVFDPTLFNCLDKNDCLVSGPVAWLRKWTRVSQASEAKRLIVFNFYFIPSLSPLTKCKIWILLFQNKMLLIFILFYFF